MEISKRGFLIESALLTHGIASISNEEMLAAWPAELDNIVWIDGGEVKIGGMADYLPFRLRSRDLIRIDCFTFRDSIERKLSGALTASGTMELCRLHGIRLAVTCGMGGIGNVPGEELCPDLPALRDIPVTLICTSPKDMLDIDATIGWLRDQGVRTIGMGSDNCTGYLFRSARTPLDMRADAPDRDLIREKTLILNPIPESERIEDISILRTADETGHRAAASGAYYHPAANNEIDRLSGGKAARIQLESIIANGKLAEALLR